MVLVVVAAVVAAIAFGAFITPIAALIPLIVGAIIANRLGYRHQAQAIRRELAPTLAKAEPPVLAAPATVTSRLEELAKLVDAGLVTADEAATRRAAILAEL